MAKTCSKCKVEKDESAYSKNKYKKDGLCTKCKVCAATYYAVYYENNKEEIAVKGAVYRENNKEEIAVKKAVYYENNKEEKAVKGAVYYESHKEEIAVKGAVYRENNKEEIAIYQSTYRENNKEEKAAYNTTYYEDNKEEIALKQATYRENNKEEISVYKAVYYENHKEEIAVKGATYRKTPSGKLNGKKHNNERKRELGWMPLNKEFPGCVGHHILYGAKDEKDSDTVIFIPAKLHKLRHGRDNPKNQQEMNIIATKWLSENAENDKIRKVAGYMHYMYCTIPAPEWFFEQYGKSKSKTKQCEVIKQ